MISVHEHKHFIDHTIAQQGMFIFFIKDIFTYNIAVYLGKTALSKKTLGNVLIHHVHDYVQTILILTHLNSGPITNYFVNLYY